ncbi:hypothetical protein ES705_34170 [subsurface metagenome]
MTAYGLDRKNVQNIEEESDKFKGFLSESLQIRKTQVIWAVRKEMARSPEDVLARRTRALFLDVKESLRIAPETAQLMADELNYNSKWVDDQLASYNKLAKGYFASPVTRNS